MESKPEESVDEKRQTPEVRISAAAMRIMRLLVGRPPVAIADLIRSMGVTRTAVTEQLNELVEAGYVERTMERLPGRGRPRNRYQATTAALVALFAGHSQIVVPAMWEAIAQTGGPDLLRRVASCVTAKIAAQYRAKITGRTPEERLRQLADMLRSEGHVMEVTKDGRGHVVLRKRSCAYIGMFESSRTICGIDLDLISAIVDAPVRQIACRHDGAPCCTFQVSLNGK